MTNAFTKTQAYEYLFQTADDTILEDLWGTALIVKVYQWVWVWEIKLLSHFTSFLALFLGVEEMNSQLSDPILYLNIYSKISEYPGQK